MTPPRKRDQAEMALVIGAADGEQESVVGLLNHYTPMLRSEAYRLRGPVDHDDLLQEGRIALLRAAEKWDSRKGEFATYARVCARHQMLAVVKRAQRQPQLLDDAEDPQSALVALAGASEVDDPMEIIAARELLSKLRPRVAALSPKTRRIYAAYVSGFSYREIGQQLGVTYTCVNRHVYRANQLVRRPPMGSGR